MDGVGRTQVEVWDFSPTNLNQKRKIQSQYYCTPANVHVVPQSLHQLLTTLHPMIQSQLAWTIRVGYKMYISNHQNLIDKCNNIGK